MNGRTENDVRIDGIINRKLRTLPDFVSVWNNKMIASDLTSATRREYICKLENFLRCIKYPIENIKVSDFDKAKVDKYLAGLNVIKKSDGNYEKSSDSYKQLVWCCLNNFFEFLIEYGYIDNNPINIKKKPKNNDLQRINESRILLTKKDFNEIITSVRNGCGSQKAKTRQQKWKNRDLGIIMLFMSTGMRETALSEINISDIDFDNNVLTVIDKGSYIHRYYLNDKTKNILIDWINDRNNLFKNVDTDALFLTYQGNRIPAKSLYKLVEKYCKDALGIGVSPHKLRAGFCSIMYNETGNIEKVRRMVGHKNIATTQRYITTDNRERMEAAEIMNDVFL